MRSLEKDLNAQDAEEHGCGSSEKEGERNSFVGEGFDAGELAVRRELEGKRRIPLEIGDMEGRFCQQRRM